MGAADPVGKLDRRYGMSSSENGPVSEPGLSNTSKAKGSGHTAGRA